MYIYIYIYIYGSAPFVIIKINIYRDVENIDGAQTRGGNMEGTWKEHGRNMKETRTITKFK